MKAIWKKWWLPILITLTSILIIWFLSRRKVDASKGGIINGPSHENGGVKADTKAGEKLELEGGEIILTAEVKNIQDKYVCEGTPSGIASEINSKIGSGVSFSDSGICRLKTNN